MRILLASSFGDWSADHSSQIAFWLAILVSVPAVFILIECVEKWKELGTSGKRNRKVFEVVALLLAALMGFWSWKASDLAAARMEAKVSALDPHKQRIAWVSAAMQLQTHGGRCRKYYPTTGDLGFLQVGRTSETNLYRLIFATDKFEQFGDSNDWYFHIEFRMNPFAGIYNLSPKDNVDSLNQFDSIWLNCVFLPFGGEIVSGDITFTINGMVPEKFRITPQKMWMDSVRTTIKRDTNSLAWNALSR